MLVQFILGLASLLSLARSAVVFSSQVAEAYGDHFHMRTFSEKRLYFKGEEKGQSAKIEINSTGSLDIRLAKTFCFVCRSGEKADSKVEEEPLAKGDFLIVGLKEDYPEYTKALASGCPQIQTRKDLEDWICQRWFFNKVYGILLRDPEEEPEQPQPQPQSFSSLVRETSGEQQSFDSDFSSGSDSDSGLGLGPGEEASKQQQPFSNPVEKTANRVSFFTSFREKYERLRLFANPGKAVSEQTQLSEQPKPFIDSAKKASKQPQLFFDSIQQGSEQENVFFSHDTKALWLRFDEYDERHGIENVSEASITFTGPNTIDIKQQGGGVALIIEPNTDAQHFTQYLPFNGDSLKQIQLTFQTGHKTDHYGVSVKAGDIILLLVPAAANPILLDGERDDLNCPTEWISLINRMIVFGDRDISRTIESVYEMHGIRYAIAKIADHQEA